MLTVLYFALVLINLLLTVFVSRRQKIYTPDLVKNTVLVVVSILASIGGFLVFRNIEVAHIALRIIVDYAGSVLFTGLATFALFRVFGWMQAQ